MAKLSIEIIKNLYSVKEIIDFNLRLNGHHVRKATKVIFTNNQTEQLQEVAFMEKLSKKEAIRQAYIYLQINN